MADYYRHYYVSRWYICSFYLCLFIVIVTFVNFINHIIFIIMQKGKFLFYKVVIGESNGEHHLELKLNEQEFQVINLSIFIDLGLVVVVHKMFDEDIYVQNT